MSDPELADEPVELGPAIGPLNENVLVTCIIMGIIGLVGIAGNSLMLRAYIKYKRLRTNFYTMFCSLSIADTIFLLVAVPGYIMEVTAVPSNGNAEDSFDDRVLKDSFSNVSWCKFSWYMMDACNFTSSYLLVVLAVLRAILLTSRNVRRQPKPFHLGILSCVIFVVAFAASVPILSTVTSSGNFCYLDISNNAIKTDVWMKVLFALFLPLGLMLIVHFVAHKLGKRYFSDSYSPREKEKSRLVIAIVGAFAICHLPFRLVSLYTTIKYNGGFLAEHIDDDLYADYWEAISRLEVVQRYMACLLTLDKAIRPILYSKLASDLSEAFDEVINCTHCSRAYFQEPLYDRPARTHLDTEGEDGVNDRATNVPQGFEALGMGSQSQTILVEKADVHNVEGHHELPDEGYGESCSSSEGSASSGGNIREHHSDNSRGGQNSRSCDRLMSTSSTVSAASATSQTPLVSRRDEEGEISDDVV